MSEVILERFLEESRELLEVANQGLLRLERTPEDASLVNTVFRAFHTIKGSSALFDFRPMTRALHAGEDLLHAIREGELGLSGDLTDVLLAVLDQVASWLDAVERAGILAENASEAADILIERARGVGGEDVARDAKPEPSSAVATAAIPDWLGFAGKLPEFVGKELVGIEYDPDPGCFFNGEDPLRLLSLVPNLLYLRVLESAEPRAQVSTEESPDPYQCRLRFRAVSSAPHREIEVLFRYVAEQVRFYRFDMGLGAQVDPCVRILREVARSLEETPEPPVAAGRRASCREIALQALTASGFPSIWREEFARVSASAIATEDDSALRAVIQQVVGSISAAGQYGARLSLLPQAVRATPSLSPARRSLTAPARRSLTPNSRSLTPGGGAALPAIAAGSATAASTVEVETRAAVAQVYKVDQTRIDALLELAGELLVTKHALPYLARRAEAGVAATSLSRELKEQAEVLGRIADGFHHAVMQLRILPISHVFDRFPRLVRDLAKQLDKRVRLELAGERTEADKSTIERLADPLIHILRNSLDHGLEPADERVSAGKSPEGVLRLSARQERGLLIVTVEDDGRGIDPDKIRATAVRRGLLSSTQANALSDEAATNLIFAAGFSTRDAVSALSGRGVGMDVVKTAVENCKGQVTLESRVGRGTRVTLSLPLSMAVTRVLLVESAGMTLGVPFDLVVETVHLAPEQIGRVQEASVATIRGRVVPLTRLAGLLRLRDERQVESDLITVLVARLPQGDLGLIVDGLREVVDVLLKPLEGPLAGMRGYLGASLLGDGRALLILNLSELV